ncbi:hypothetical protein GCM10023192_45030 [Amycolatopsis samaneae]
MRDRDVCWRVDVLEETADAGPSELAGGDQACSSCFRSAKDVGEVLGVEDSSHDDTVTFETDNFGRTSLE